MVNVSSESVKYWVRNGTANVDPRLNPLATLRSLLGIYRISISNSPIRYS
jgi:hypothetical protein